MSPARMLQKLDFDTPPTVGVLIEALEDLRASAGPDAIVRVTGVIEFNINGCRIASVCAERPTAAPKPEPDRPRRR